MDRINKGSIEHLIVNLKDRTESVSDLAGKGAVFSVRRKSDQEPIVTDQLAGVLGMEAYCLIDTTDVDFTKDVYELFLKFNNLPEQPLVGPVEFSVN